jgi:hypothetical protein
MTVFDELQREILLLKERGEFPEWLLPQLEQIAGNPERFSDCSEEVRTLVDQLQGYDPYAGVGCFSDSTSLEAIERTLKRLIPPSGSR